MKDLEVKNIVAEATGELRDTFIYETGVGFDTDVLLTPTFSQIKMCLNGQDQGFISKYPNANMLIPIAGARAIVSYAVKDSKMPNYAPGIVLQDGRLGVLHNIADSKQTPEELENFTDFQQLLLAGVFARQRDTVGVSHESGIAELGHATLIALSSDPNSIHKTTHEFADTRQFGTKVARMTTLYQNHKSRPTETTIMKPTQAIMLFKPQLQSPLPANGFEASAGFALAATKTQDRKIDLKANVGAMVAQMGV